MPSNSPQAKAASRDNARVKKGVFIDPNHHPRLQGDREAEQAYALGPINALQTRYNAVWKGARLGVDRDWA
jgi:hypothetical protein